MLAIGSSIILVWLWPEASLGETAERAPMAERIGIARKLPVGAIDTRASGWWAMIFIVFTEASLFAYLLFSYYYLAVQPHLPGTFPQGGAPSLALALPEHDHPARFRASRWRGRNSTSSITTSGIWCWGLGIGAVLGMIFLVVQIFRMGRRNRSGLSSSPYSSLYFTITGFHMAHVVVGVCMLWALLCLVGAGLFQSRALRPYPYRRALLAFRRCGVARGVLHLLHHAAIWG